MLKLLLILMFFALAGQSEAEVLWGYGPNADRDRIQLHDSPCTIKVAGTERYPFLTVNGRTTNHATISSDDGKSFTGCWALLMMDDVPHVILKWEDGDNGHLLLSAFHKPKAAP